MSLSLVTAVSRPPAPSSLLAVEPVAAVISHLKATMVDRWLTRSFVTFVEPFDIVTGRNLDAVAWESVCRRHWNRYESILQEAASLGAEARSFLDQSSVLIAASAPEKVEFFDQRLQPFLIRSAVFAARSIALLPGLYGEYLTSLSKSSGAQLDEVTIDQKIFDMREELKVHRSGWLMTGLLADDRPEIVDLSVLAIWLQCAWNISPYITVPETAVPIPSSQGIVEGVLLVVTKDFSKIAEQYRSSLIASLTCGSGGSAIPAAELVRDPRFLTLSETKLFAMKVFESGVFELTFALPESDYEGMAHARDSLRILSKFYEPLAAALNCSIGCVTSRSSSIDSLYEFGICLTFPLADDDGFPTPDREVADKLSKDDSGAAYLGLLQQSFARILPDGRRIAFAASSRVLETGLLEDRTLMGAIDSVALARPDIDFIVAIDPSETQPLEASEIEEDESGDSEIDESSAGISESAPGLVFNLRNIGGFLSRINRATESLLRSSVAALETVAGNGFRATPISDPVLEPDCILCNAVVLEASLRDERLVEKFVALVRRHPISTFVLPEVECSEVLDGIVAATTSYERLFPAAPPAGLELNVAVYLGATATATSALSFLDPRGLVLASGMYSVERKEYELAIVPDALIPTISGELVAIERDLMRMYGVVRLRALGDELCRRGYVFPDGVFIEAFEFLRGHQGKMGRAPAKNSWDGMLRKAFAEHQLVRFEQRDGIWHFETKCDLPRDGTFGNCSQGE